MRKSSQVNLLPWSFRLLRRLHLLKKVRLEMRMNQAQCIEFINQLKRNKLWQIEMFTEKDQALLTLRHIRYSRGRPDEVIFIACRVNEHDHITTLILEANMSNIILDWVLHATPFIFTIIFVTLIVTTPRFPLALVIEGVLSQDSGRLVCVAGFAIFTLFWLLSYLMKVFAFQEFVDYLQKASTISAPKPESTHPAAETASHGD